MSAELARAVERLRQLKQTTRQAHAAAGELRAADVKARTGELVPGDRVFDPVTGLEGVVEHAASANVVVQAAER
jgi:hypothetical protein